jgi:hypothetical protein
MPQGLARVEYAVIEAVVPAAALQHIRAALAFHHVGRQAAQVGIVAASTNATCHFSACRDCMASRGEVTLARALEPFPACWRNQLERVGQAL